MAKNVVLSGLVISELFSNTHTHTACVAFPFSTKVDHNWRGLSPFCYLAKANTPPLGQSEPLQHTAHSPLCSVNFHSFLLWKFCQVIRRIFFNAKCWLYRGIDYVSGGRHFLFARFCPPLRETAKRKHAWRPAAVRPVHSLVGTTWIGHSILSMHQCISFNLLLEWNVN